MHALTLTALLSCAPVLMCCAVLCCAVVRFCCTPLLCSPVLHMYRESQALRSLDGCLKNPQALELFLAFLQLRRTEENLLFWSAAEEYRVRKRTPAERKVRGGEIFDRFVKEAAEHDIGVKAGERAAVKAGIERGDEGALLSLQNKVFAQMDGDSFPLFLGSDLYKRIIVSSVQHTLPPSVIAML
jgi:hypothetical protein